MFFRNVVIAEGLGEESSVNTSILRISAIVDKLLISIWLKYPEH